MIQNMPTIGVRYDIDKAGGGYRGFACWKIFWQAINPEEIGDAALYEGDTAATLNKQERVFYIAVQSLDPEASTKIKVALAQSEAFQRVCAKLMFVEGAGCAEEPLAEAGSIDAKGNLTGGAGVSRSALKTVKKERTTASKAAEEEVAKKRAEEEQKPRQDTERTYFTVHCPYCGGQKLYDKNGVVYCDNEKCPNGEKPVDIDRYNLRRLIF